MRKKQALDVFAVRTRAVDLVAKRNKLEKRLAKAVASQAKYYNAKHFPQLYNIENVVYLNSKNIELTHSTKKLDWKYYGPYKMIDKIGKMVY